MKNKCLNIIYKGYNRTINIDDSQIYNSKHDYLLHRYKDGNRKIFLDEKLNYTCIEILENDKIINENDLFKTENRKIYVDKFKEIFSMHYPKGKDLSISFGKISNIINDEINFEHNCCMDEGCLGAPLIERNKIKNIIGIHSAKKEKINLGNSIYYIFYNIKLNYILAINKDKINNFKTIKNQESRVNNIILIDNERFSSCFDDGQIIIYNIKTFEIIQIIPDKVEINYHYKLSNNNIISCCSDGTLKIYAQNYSIVNSILNRFWSNSDYHYSLIQILKGHKNSLCKVIEINDNLIASCGLDTEMKIWKKEINNYACIKSIILHGKENCLTNILKINESEVVSVSTTSDYITFWDIIKCGEKKSLELKNIIAYPSSMILDDNDKLIISVISKGIFFINTSNYQIIENIIDDNISMTSIYILNGKIFMGIEDDEAISSLIEYKYENQKLIKVRENKKAHENIITSLIVLENGEIISCSKDNNIKFWI